MVSLTLDNFDKQMNIFDKQKGASYHKDVWIILNFRVWDCEF